MFFPSYHFELELLVLNLLSELGRSILVKGPV